MIITYIWQLIEHPAVAWFHSNGLSNYNPPTTTYKLGQDSGDTSEKIGNGIGRERNEEKHDNKNCKNDLGGVLLPQLYQNLSLSLNLITNILNALDQDFKYVPPPIEMKSSPQNSAAKNRTLHFENNNLIPKHISKNNSNQNQNSPLSFSTPSISASPFRNNTPPRLRWSSSPNHRRESNLANNDRNNFHNIVHSSKSAPTTPRSLVEHSESHVIRSIVRFLSQNNDDQMVDENNAPQKSQDFLTKLNDFIDSTSNQLSNDRVSPIGGLESSQGIIGPLSQFGSTNDSQSDSNSKNNSKNEKSGLKMPSTNTSILNRSLHLRPLHHLENEPDVFDTQDEFDGDNSLSNLEHFSLLDLLSQNSNSQKRPENNSQNAFEMSSLSDGTSSDSDEVYFSDEESSDDEFDEYIENDAGSQGQSQKNIKNNVKNATKNQNSLLKNRRLRKRFFNNKRRARRASNNHSLMSIEQSPKAVLHTSEYNRLYDIWRERKFSKMNKNWIQYHFEKNKIEKEKGKIKHDNFDDENNTGDIIFEPFSLPFGGDFMGNHDEMNDLRNFLHTPDKDNENEALFDELFNNNINTISQEKTEKFNHQNIAPNSITPHNLAISDKTLNNIAKLLEQQRQLKQKELDLEPFNNNILFFQAIKSRAKMIFFYLQNLHQNSQQSPSSLSSISLISFPYQFLHMTPVELFLRDSGVNFEEICSSHFLLPIIGIDTFLLIIILFFQSHSLGRKVAQLGLIQTKKSVFQHEYLKQEVYCDGLEDFLVEKMQELVREEGEEGEEGEDDEKNQNRNQTENQNGHFFGNQTHNEFSSHLLNQEYSTQLNLFFSTQCVHFFTTLFTLDVVFLSLYLYISHHLQSGDFFSDENLTQQNNTTSESTKLEGDDYITRHNTIPVDNIDVTNSDSDLDDRQIELTFSSQSSLDKNEDKNEFNKDNRFLLPDVQISPTLPLSEPTLIPNSSLQGLNQYLNQTISPLISLKKNNFNRDNLETNNSPNNSPHSSPQATKTNIIADILLDSPPTGSTTPVSSSIPLQSSPLVSFFGRNNDGSFSDFFLKNDEKNVRNVDHISPPQLDSQNDVYSSPIQQPGNVSLPINPMTPYTLNSSITMVIETPKTTNLTSKDDNFGRKKLTFAKNPIFKIIAKFPAEKYVKKNNKIEKFDKNEKMIEKNKFGSHGSSTPLPHLTNSPSSPGRIVYSDSESDLSSDSDDYSDSCHSDSDLEEVEINNPEKELVSLNNFDNSTNNSIDSNLVQNANPLLANYPQNTHKTSPNDGSPGVKRSFSQLDDINTEEGDVVRASKKQQFAKEKMESAAEPKKSGQNIDNMMDLHHKDEGTVKPHSRGMLNNEEYTHDGMDHSGGENVKDVNDVFENYFSNDENTKQVKKMNEKIDSPKAPKPILKPSPLITNLHTPLYISLTPLMETLMDFIELVSNTNYIAPYQFPQNNIIETEKTEKQEGKNNLQNALNNTNLFSSINSSNQQTMGFTSNSNAIPSIKPRSNVHELPNELLMEENDENVTNSPNPKNSKNSPKLNKLSDFFSIYKTSIPSPPPPIPFQSAQPPAIVSNMFTSPSVLFSMSGSNVAWLSLYLRQLRSHQSTLRYYNMYIYLSNDNVMMAKAKESTEEILMYSLSWIGYGITNKSHDYLRQPISPR
jgi:hypothetical protein